MRMAHEDSLPLTWQFLAFIALSPLNMTPLGQLFLVWRVMSYMPPRFQNLFLLPVLLGLFISSTTLADAPLRIREGSSSYGKVTMTVTGNKVRLGDSSYGPVVFTIDGNKIREGDSSYGPVIATVDDHGRVRQGDSAYGKTIATVTGNQVKEGDSTYGKAIATTEGGRMSGAAAASLMLLR
jgi:hypothetical protein